MNKYEKHKLTFAKTSTMTSQLPSYKNVIGEMEFLQQIAHRTSQQM